MLGAFLTMVTYVLILINLGIALQSFFNDTRQSENQQIRLYDRFTAGDFSLVDNKLTLAVPFIETQLAKVRLSKHTRKKVVHTDEIEGVPIVSIVDQFDQIPIDNCSQE